MRVSRTQDSPTKVTLTVTADTADLSPIHRHVLGHFRRNVKVPGFRTGKAPVELVEKNVNQQALLDEFMEHALNELYRQAISAEKLRPTATPDVQLKKFVPYTELQFEIKLDVIGPIKLPNYKAIRQPKPKVSITAKDIDEVIKSLQNRLAERVETKRAAKLGDELIIDFAGKDSDGKAINGTDGKDYPLLLGGNSFIPGFEDNLIGISSGGSKEFEVAFPKDYGVAAMRQRKVIFNVQVKKVNELKMPKVDDELAKKAGPFNTLAELKADIKKELSAERQRQADIDHQNELIRRITEESHVDLPQNLLDDELTRLEDEEKRNLAYRGQTWQEHLKEEGVSEQEHRGRYKPEAQERVKAGLVLSEISELEGLQVTPQELEIRMQLLKNQYQDPQMRAELDKPDAARDIQARLLTEKTIDKLVEYASGSK
ncbi:MAG TPA: trigger factor [Candidatus Saccharimonadales bacterium]|nr:trigger factor [Candidatus Saccharimonadales bacterium]